MEEKIGEIVHYFSKLSVAAIRLTSGKLKVGDKIRIKGHTTDFTQVVDSMQIEHEAVTECEPGVDVGIKVQEKVRHGDTVYKITQEEGT
jgi:putative protease